MSSFFRQPASDASFLSSTPEPQTNSRTRAASFFFSRSLFTAAWTSASPCSFTTTAAWAWPCLGPELRQMDALTDMLRGARRLLPCRPPRACWPRRLNFGTFK
eukprot:5816209-Prymnesium_polylepis.1